MLQAFSLAGLVIALLGQAPDEAAALKTVAERSDFRATARYDDVLAWCQHFAKATPNANLTELGRSAEGRSIPLLIVADPPVKTAAEAARSGKLVCLVIGNIHAGEVCGKEALPMLLREQFMGPHPPLLKDVILAVAPIYNTDGNERVSKTNRPGQVGPDEGMGQRANARGLDLNRDFIKLEAPETRGLVKFLNDWNPHLFIDTHTTNGSYHRYTITYEGPKNPAGDRAIFDFMHRTFFPQVTSSFKKRTGLESFYYGNFNRGGERKEWTSYPAEGRYGTTYVGLRNRLSVLSEAYAYAPYKTRILATRDFVLDCLETAVAHKAQVMRMTGGGSRGARATGGPTEQGGAAQQVAIRSRAKAAGAPATVLGYVEKQENGRRVKPDTPQDYTLKIMNDYEAAESVTRPYAYLVPASCTAAVENLKRHGIELQELREDIELDVEIYKVDELERGSRRNDGGHNAASLKVTPRRESRRVAAGTLLVPASQKLGDLAVYLLEPRSEDGLAVWNFFDADLAQGVISRCCGFPSERHPWSRRPSPSPSTPAKSGRSRREWASAAVAAGGVAGSSDSRAGSTAGTGSQCATAACSRFDAETGQAQPFIDAKVLAAGLAHLPSLDADTVQSVAGRTNFNMDPQKRGFLFEHGQDLYYASFDGKTAVRLTKDPGASSSRSSAPTASRWRSCANYDLYAVDIATQTERRLTTGGREDLRHGHADWVYFEEIFNRRWPAFWWSPDSKQIAFMEFDDDSVPYHTVLDDAYQRDGTASRENPLSAIGRAESQGSPGRRSRRRRPGALGRSVGVFAELITYQRSGLAAQ